MRSPTACRAASATTSARAMSSSLRLALLPRSDPALPSLLPNSPYQCVETHADTVVDVLILTAVSMTPLLTPAALPKNPDL